MTKKIPQKMSKNGSLNLKNVVPVEAKWWVVKKQFFSQNKKSQKSLKNMLRRPCPNPVFAVNSYDFHTQKRIPFWLPFGSIWTPHAPKTQFFTMNFNDFRNVVWRPRPWNLRQFHVFEGLDPEICDSCTVLEVFTPNSGCHMTGPGKRKPPPPRRPEGHLCQKQGFRMGVVQNSEILVSACCLEAYTPCISEPDACSADWGLSDTASHAL